MNANSNKNKNNNTTTTITMATVQEGQVATKIYKTVDNAKKLKALFRKDKDLAKKLYQMNKFEFDDFLLAYNEQEKKFLKYLRRTEQIRINVKNWRGKMQNEITELEADKAHLLEDRTQLETEIQILKRELNLD